jgi:hypothetical protein
MARSDKTKFHVTILLGKLTGIIYSISRKNARNYRSDLYLFRQSVTLNSKTG